MWQLQSHSIALGHNMEDMFSSLLILVVRLLLLKLMSNQIIINGVVQDNLGNNINTLQHFGLRGWLQTWTEYIVILDIFECF